MTSRRLPSSARFLIMLVLAAALAAGLWYFLSPATPPNAPINRDARPISDFVKVEERHDARLPHTAWLFQKPLLPYARLLKVRPWKGSFWFSGDSGLVEFDRDTGDWWLYDREHGLPGDTAYDLAVSPEEGLLIWATEFTGPGALKGTGHYWFRYDGYRPTDVRISQVVVPEEVKVDNLEMYRPRFSTAIRHDGYLWVGSLGTHKQEKDRFEGGGVYRIDLDARHARFWNEEDGIANSYCHSLTSDQYGHVWVSHFREERGLSRFDPDAGTWETIKDNPQGIHLGGIELASADRYLLVAQQDGLVIHDIQSGNTRLIEEEDGLPGYITSDVIVEGSDIWVTAFAYGGGRTDNMSGKRSTGMIHFTVDDINGLFDKPAKERPDFDY